MSVLTRFKSDEKLQAEALDILSELIKRDLLRVDVRISDPSMVLACRPAEVYVTGDRSATVDEILRWYGAGVPPKGRRGPGITISLAGELRLTPDQEAQARQQIRKG